MSVSPMVCIIEDSALAPLSMPAIWNQRPGTAWAKSWSMVSGFGA